MANSQPTFSRVDPVSAGLSKSRINYGDLQDAAGAPLSPRAAGCLCVVHATAFKKMFFNKNLALPRGSTDDSKRVTGGLPFIRAPSSAAQVK